MSCSINKHPRILLKLDLEKAFDFISWDAIKNTLYLMNFPYKFIEWIIACIFSPNFTYLINRYQSNCFKSKRCIRQGDPLSPYLFILVLSSLITKVINMNKITPFSLRGTMVSHLMFADDLLLAFRANHKSCSIVLQILRVFQNLTHLRVNLDKSHFYFPKHCDPSSKHLVYNSLVIKEGSWPFKYLGTYIS